MALDEDGSAELESQQSRYPFRTKTNFANQAPSVPIAATLGSRRGQSNLAIRVVNFPTNLAQYVGRAHELLYQHARNADHLMDAGQHEHGAGYQGSGECWATCMMQLTGVHVTSFNLIVPANERLDFKICSVSEYTVALHTFEIHRVPYRFRQF